MTPHTSQALRTRYMYEAPDTSYAWYQESHTLPSSMQVMERPTRNPPFDMHHLINLVSLNHLWEHLLLDEVDNFLHGVTKKTNERIEGSP